MDLYFSDIFHVPKKSLDEYGAFDISLITDLPLFIDPFLLFESDKPEYKALHESIIKYLVFLRDKSAIGPLPDWLLESWFHFNEVKQTWFGFTALGNSGHGLGRDFALSLSSALPRLVKSFGSETITRSPHLEKLCLIKRGVGRDTISDFTTNLIKSYLLEYTENFAKKHIDDKLTQEFHIRKVKFDYHSERWESGKFTLPLFKGDYVLLTPIDLLTKDDTWINRSDFVDDYYKIINAMPNQQIRGELDNYLQKILKATPKREEYERAITDFSILHPDIIDYYIKYKEDNGEEAVKRSRDIVIKSDYLYIEQFSNLVRLLSTETDFYKVEGITAKEALDRILFLKDFVENKGGWRLLYDKDGRPIRREEDIKIMYRLTWYGTKLDVSREVNDGRGPADIKVSLGSPDKTIVEIKLASNSKLKKNLQNQTAIYQRASDAHTGLKVIVYYNDKELATVKKVLEELGLEKDKNIILIDAGPKESASNV